MSGRVHLSNGDVVLFQGGIAVVRSFGKVKFGRGEWVGLELSGPMGDTDGSKNGVRYFKCKKRHGLFIRLSDVKRKITAEELLLKLNESVEKSPKGRLSSKEKKVTSFIMWKKVSYLIKVHFYCRFFFAFFRVFSRFFYVCLCFISTLIKFSQNQSKHFFY